MRFCLRLCGLVFVIFLVRVLWWLVMVRCCWVVWVLSILFRLLLKVIWVGLFLCFLVCVLVILVVC